jgi:hypothetical protein
MEALFDPVDNLLWIGAGDFSKSGTGKPVVIRCDANGVNCVSFNAAVQQGAKSAVEARSLLDTTNHRLLIITDDVSNGSRLALFAVDI